MLWGLLGKFSDGVFSVNSPGRFSCGIFSAASSELYYEIHVLGAFNELCSTCLDVKLMLHVLNKYIPLPHSLTH